MVDNAGERYYIKYIPCGGPKSGRLVVVGPFKFEFAAKHMLFLVRQTRKLFMSKLITRSED